MKKNLQLFIYFVVVISSMVAASTAVAEMNDEPVLYYIKAHELEMRRTSGDNAFNWDISAWVGTTRNRLVLRTEGEAGEDETEEFETLLLYSRAVSPFWNINAGWRADWQPVARRNWATLELEGLAPGFIETRLSLLAGGQGRWGARFMLETEWYLTRYIKLIPLLETDWYNEADPLNGRGSGLASLELGARLGYAIRPDVLPYIGVAWTGLYGESRDIATAGGADARVTQLVAGISIWF